MVREIIEGVQRVGGREKEESEITEMIRERGGRMKRVRNEKQITEDREE